MDLLARPTAKRLRAGAVAVLYLTINIINNVFIVHTDISNPKFRGDARKDLGVQERAMLMAPASMAYRGAVPCGPPETREFDVMD